MLPASPVGVDFLAGAGGGIAAPGLDAIGEEAGLGGGKSSRSGGGPMGFSYTGSFRPTNGQVAKTVSCLHRRMDTAANVG
jgi:hypothetical protein